VRKILQLALLLALLAWCVPARAQASFFGAGAIAANASADITPALPASVAENDIIFVSCWSRSTSDTLSVSGYTQLDVVDTGASRHWIFWKRAGASESNPTCDFSSAVNHYGRTVVVRGADQTGDPWDAISDFVADNGTTDPTSFTGITTGAANDLVLVIDNYQDNDGSVATVTGTDPAAYTESYAESGTGNDGAIEFSYATRTSAGATGSISINYGTISSRADGADDSGDMAVIIISLAEQPCTGVCFVNIATAEENDSASSLACPATSHTTGNSIIVGFKWETNMGTIDSITDTAGNTYTHVSAGPWGYPSPYDARHDMWYAHNITGNGSNVVTANFTEAHTFNIMFCAQYSGMSNEAPETTATGAATGTSVTTGSFSPAASGNANIAVGSADSSGGSFTQGSNYVERAEDPGAQAAGDAVLEDRLSAPSGAQTASVTYSVSQDLGLNVVSFKPSAGGGPTPRPPTLMMMGVGD
jgi:hypothetical protein